MTDDEVGVIDEVVNEFHCQNETHQLARLLAAQLVVLRKIEFAVTELLTYKQHEVHQ